MIKYLLLILILVPNLLFADSCINTSWQHKDSFKNGFYRSVYITNETPNIQDILCILGSDFINNISSFPDNALLSIINIETTTGYIIKWSIAKNDFFISKFENKIGMASLYKQPLNRIGELLSNRDLPNLDNLEDSNVKYVKISIDNSFLKILLED